MNDRALPSVAVLAALSLLAAGCAERQAQVAVQTGLNVLAEGLSAVDEIASERASAPAETARAQVRAERAECASRGPEECPEATDVDAWLARYDALMEHWTALSTGLGAARQSLYLGQSALTLWVTSGSLPLAGREFCAGAEGAFESLGGLLTAVGIDVPQLYTDAVPSVDLVCAVILRWATEE